MDAEQENMALPAETEADGVEGTFVEVEENIEDLVAIQTAALAEVAKQEQQAAERERSRSPTDKRGKRSGSRDRGGRGGRDRGGRDKGGDRRRDRDRGRERFRPTYTSIPGAKRNKVIRYDCCVFISNIEYKVTWQELKDVLKRHVGDVGYVELFTQSDGTSKGCAFVEFKSKDDAKKALTEMDRFEVHNRKLVVKEDSEGRHSEKYFRQREAEATAKEVLTPQLLNRLNLDPNNLCDTVFVANLPYDVSWRKLKDVFRVAGPVARVDIIEEKGKSRGMATVQFETILGAVNAISQLDNSSLFDRTLAVRMDKEKLRSTGGGKESAPRPPPLPSGLSGVGPSIESLARGGDLGRGDLGRGDLGRGDMGRGNDFGRGGGGGGGGGLPDLGGYGGGSNLPQGLGGIGNPIGGLGSLGLGSLGGLGGGSGLQSLSQNLGQSLSGGLGSGLGSYGGSGMSSSLGSSGLSGLGGLGGLGSLGNSGSGFGPGSSDLGRNSSGLGNFDLGIGSGNLGGGSQSLLGGNDLDRGLMGLSGLYGNNDRDFMDNRDRDRGMGFGSGGGGGGSGGGGGGGRDRFRDNDRNGRRDRNRGDRGDRRDRGDNRNDRRSGGGGGGGNRGGGGGRGRDNKGDKGTPREGGTQVFVRNLPFSFTWPKLKEIFQNVGNVTFASVKTDEKGKSRGFGTVRFENTMDAQNAINEISGNSYEGREINVSLDCY